MASVTREQSGRQSRPLAHICLLLEKRHNNSSCCRDHQPETPSSLLRPSQRPIDITPYFCHSTKRRFSIIFRARLAHRKKWFILIGSSMNSLFLSMSIARKMTESQKFDPIINQLIVQSLFASVHPSFASWKQIYLKRREYGTAQWWLTSESVALYNHTNWSDLF